MRVLLGPDPILTLATALLLFLALCALLVTIGHRPPPLASVRAAPQLLWLVIYLLATAVLSAIGLPFWEEGSDKEAWTKQTMLHVLVWSVVPSALLLLRFWQWPIVRIRPSWRLIYIGGCIWPCTLLASFVVSPDFQETTSYILASYLTLTALAAFSEEFVFRVMLLSYLRIAIGSPTASLILASAAFALLHVPGAIGSMPSDLLVRFAFVQVAAGIFYGVLWLRTRSWLIVGVAHTLFNLLSGVEEMAAVWE